MAQLRQKMTRDADKQAQRIESACGSPSSLGQCMALVTSANLSLTNLITGYEYANSEEKKAVVGDLLGRQLDDMSRLYKSLATQQEAAGARDLVAAAITGSLQAAGTMGMNVGSKRPVDYEVPRGLANPATCKVPSVVYRDGATSLEAFTRSNR